MRFHPYGLIAVAGAAFMICGVFMQWAAGTVDVFFVSKYLTYTGWDFIGNENLEKVADFNKVPGFTLLFGMICMALSVLPLFRNRAAAKTMSSFSMVVCAVLMGFQMRFYEDVSAGMNFFGHRLVEADAGAGLWVSFAGCMLLALGCFVNVVMREEPAEIESTDCTE